MEKKCPTCGYIIKDDKQIRCPRCFTSLTEFLKCSGSCKKCKINSNCKK